MLRLKLKFFQLNKLKATFIFEWRNISVHNGMISKQFRNKTSTWSLQYRMQSMLQSCPNDRWANDGVSKVCHFSTYFSTATWYLHLDKIIFYIRFTISQIVHFWMTVVPQRENIFNFLLNLRKINEITYIVPVIHRSPCCFFIHLIKYAYL